MTFTPGARIEEFFEEFFRCAREGRASRKGMPPLPVAARLGLAHDMYFAHTPVPIQRATMRMLTGAARVLPADRR